MTVVGTLKNGYFQMPYAPTDSENYQRTHNLSQSTYHKKRIYNSFCLNKPCSTWEFFARSSLYFGEIATLNLFTIVNLMLYSFFAGSKISLYFALIKNTEFIQKEDHMN
jgi:hypothetical protein